MPTYCHDGYHPINSFRESLNSFRVCSYGTAFTLPKYTDWPPVVVYRCVDFPTRFFCNLGGWAVLCLRSKGGIVEPPFYFIHKRKIQDFRIWKTISSRFLGVIEHRELPSFSTRTRGRGDTARGSTISASLRPVSRSMEST